MIDRKNDGKHLIKDFYGKTKKETLSKLDGYKIQTALGTLSNDDKIIV